MMRVQIKQFKQKTIGKSVCDRENVNITLAISLF